MSVSCNVYHWRDERRHPEIFCWSRARHCLNTKSRMVRDEEQKDVFSRHAVTHWFTAHLRMESLFPPPFSLDGKFVFIVVILTLICDVRSCTKEVKMNRCTSSKQRIFPWQERTWSSVQLKQSRQTKHACFITVTRETFSIVSYCCA